jgi:hypothetical protein
VIPKLDFPLRIINSRFVVNEQDTNEDQATQVAVLCSFERGFRIEAPSFGINDPSFTNMPIDLDDLSEALAEYAPDAMVDVRQYNDSEGFTRVQLEVSAASEVSEEE